MEHPERAPDHSGLMPANLMTLVHLSIFSAMNLANSPGEFGGTDGAEISEPLLDIRVEHRCVGLLVERRDDLRRRGPWGRRNRSSQLPRSP